MDQDILNVGPVASMTSIAHLDYVWSGNVIQASFYVTQFVTKPDLVICI